MWKINSEHEWTENTGSQPRNPDITLHHAVWAFSHFCNKIIHYHTFRISFVKLVTDLFILLAFAAFFYLFSFFVIFFRFLLCFVVFLIWWCFLALLLASQDHCNFCYFLLSAMVGLLCQSQERLRNPSRREVPRHKVFLLLMIHQDKFNSVRKRRGRSASSEIYRRAEVKTQTALSWWRLLEKFKIISNG